MKEALFHKENKKCGINKRRSNLMAQKNVELDCR
nr:MAG TPA: hypothetical protein [Caudoviricetes sp.]